MDYIFEGLVIKNLSAKKKDFVDYLQSKGMVDITVSDIPNTSEEIYEFIKNLDDRFKFELDNIDALNGYLDLALKKLEFPLYDLFTGKLVFFKLRYGDTQTAYVDKNYNIVFGTKFYRNLKTFDYFFQNMPLRYDLFAFRNENSASKIPFDLQSVIFVSLHEVYHAVKSDLFENQKIIEQYIRFKKGAYPNLNDFLDENPSFINQIVNIIADYLNNAMLVEKYQLNPPPIGLYDKNLSVHNRKLYEIFDEILEKYENNLENLMKDIEKQEKFDDHNKNRDEKEQSGNGPGSSANQNGNDNKNQSKEKGDKNTSKSSSKSQGQKSSSDLEDDTDSGSGKEGDKESDKEKEGSGSGKGKEGDDEEKEGSGSGKKGDKESNKGKEGNEDEEGDNDIDDDILDKILQSPSDEDEELKRITQDELKKMASEPNQKGDVETRKGETTLVDLQLDEETKNATNLQKIFKKYFVKFLKYDVEQEEEETYTKIGKSTLLKIPLLIQTGAIEISPGVKLSEKINKPGLIFHIDTSGSVAEKYPDYINAVYNFIKRNINSLGNLFIVQPENQTKMRIYYKPANEDNIYIYRGGYDKNIFEKMMKNKPKKLNVLKKGVNSGVYDITPSTIKFEMELLDTGIYNYILITDKDALAATKSLKLLLKTLKKMEKDKWVIFADNYSYNAWYSELKNFGIKIKKGKFTNLVDLTKKGD